ncbi:MAG: glucuronate isomerase [Ruminococcaceae bacterium]|nr:glucuronate isomerase [Oscillospiraceae bacterium]
MSYMKPNFLLSTPAAERLYFDYAKDMPIFDYHCHLPERQILENLPCADLCDLWLSGDHYKWRLMRNYGIDEAYVTGKKSPEERFVAFCKVLGTAYGNPIYHWSQLEIESFFDCELEINEANAPAILAQCNSYIRENGVTPQKLIERSNVRALCTTNEVFDDLTVFDRIAENGYGFRVMPAFRGDKIMNIDASDYRAQLDRLAALTHPIKGLEDLESALELRLLEFRKRGTCACDISVERVYAIPSEEEADRVLQTVLNGQAPTAAEAETFKGYLTYFLMKLYAKHNLATELHVGAMRNNNAVMLSKIGADTGFDSISDANSITLMSRLFDRLNSEGALPRTIVFNLNPKMNAEIMALIGCFQSGEARGKLQYGAAWWFLDNKVGMERHLEDLTATGHIAAFVGMLTDSRSLLSYPRHHYFRRILCNYLGGMMSRGEMTSDEKAVGEVVRDVCYRNSIRYFGLDRDPFFQN